MPNSSSTITTAAAAAVGFAALTTTGAFVPLATAPRGPGFRGRPGMASLQVEASGEKASFDHGRMQIKVNYQGNVNMNYAASDGSAFKVGGSLTLFSAATAGAVFAASKKKGGNKTTSKVSRRFFGGDSTPAYKSFDVTTERGVQEPVGFWDPLGLAGDNDEASFKRRRSVELKHGRVCMAATIGYIVPEYFKFPGYLSPSQGIQFADVPNGLAALSKVPAIGWVQIIFFAGIIEGAFGVGEYKDGVPGEFGWKVITSDDPAEKEKKLAAEIANGRLAMVSIIGMFFQDGLTGSAWGDWALYTGSPLRAADDAPKPPPFDPSKQIGAMAPLGFFDPAGFSKTGDEEGFRNLRVAEIKHSRVAMMAALGGVIQHYVKFPGFEKVPAGLGAVTTAPGTYGFVALFLISGAMELGVWTQDPKKEPGNFGDPLGLGQYDEDMRNKELNNGRFAMFAALGIVAADLVTGKDAMQQFGL